MKSHITSPHAKQIGQVTLATLLVAGTPVAVVWWLRVSGTIDSEAITLLVGVVLSLMTSWAGRVVWEKRQGSEDLLFSELMVWGYLHRRHAQRRLSSAAELAAPLQSASGSCDGRAVREQTRLLERLVSGMETRDPYLHGHSRRVARHSWMIARRMKLPAEEVARIRTAAALHDVGKTKTPKTILHKAGALTDEEYRIIKLHPGEGAEMASVLGDAELAAMIRHHHERLDGSGYPDGLRGEQIPLGARIIAVADTFDAITSARPYRAASPHRKAIDILHAEAATKLDPDVVRAFCGHYAGRGPVALWSFVCSVPERLLSWLTASAGTFATAAKVVAVAAIVGGAAATSATLGIASSARAGHHRESPRAPRTAAAAVASRASAAAAVSSAPSTHSSARQTPKAGGGHAHRVAQTRTGATASPVSRAVQVADTAPATSQTGAGSTAPRREGSSGAAAKEGAQSERTRQPVASESPKAPREETTVKGKGKVPAKGKSEEPVAKGKGEEAPAKGKSEEAPGKSKSEEPVAKGKSEEAPGKSKSEEPVVKGKSEEPSGHGNSGAGNPGKGNSGAGSTGQGPGKAEAGLKASGGEPG